MMASERRERMREGDEIAGDEPGALVNQLVKGVLAVGAGLTPVDRAGVVSQRLAVERHTLAVALHRQLLEVSGEAFQILLVRQDRHSLSTEKIVVPEGEQAH